MTCYRYTREKQEIVVEISRINPDFDASTGVCVAGARGSAAPLDSAWAVSADKAIACCWQHIVLQWLQARSRNVTPHHTLLCLLVRAAAYSLSALQTELNRWGARYYSKDGREPLLYLTVLLLSLQFRRGLAFLLRADMAKPYRLDGVHMAVALQYSGVRITKGLCCC